jgi:hypothetical protein
MNILIAAGTDFPASYGENCGDDIFQEMRLLEEAGVPRIKILQAVTVNGARKLGREDEIGMIAKGHRANLVFWNGDVDKDVLSPERVSGVMLNGDIVFWHNILALEYTRGFRTKSLLVFPYCFWDVISQFNIGASGTEFDLFNTGVSVAADTIWSIRNMWAANLMLSVPSRIPRTSLRIGAHFDNLNRMFYGIGNSTVSDSGIEYASNNSRVGISATNIWQKHWKLTGSAMLDHFRFNTYQNQQLPPVTGSQGGNQTVLSLLFAYDTRDHENNPWKGGLISAGIDVGPSFMGNYDFTRAALDVRGYLSPAHKHILTGRLFYRQTFGDVPFYYLPDYGGNLLGRGYYSSRFIDRVGMYGQFEYRFPIWKIISGVVFFDEGQVQSVFSHFSLRGFHPSFGFGLRFAFGSNENSILGLDAGFSPEGSTIMFHTGHAF